MSARNVLITGATSGLGDALLEIYSNNGDNVIAFGRNEAQLTVIKSNVFQTCLFDNTNQEAVESQSKRVDEFDILLLNAGNFRYINSAITFHGKLFADVINTNLTSLGYLLEYFLPKVKKAGKLFLLAQVPLFYLYRVVKLTVHKKQEWTI